MVLQWGHRLSAMETTPHRRPVFQTLQWGHRLSDGKPPSRPQPRIRTPFGDGNFIDSHSFYGCPLCCHLVSLQWGHRLSAMETARDLTASIALQWCFNGATAFRRWKQGHKEIRFTSRANASMEPPPFGDGNTPCLASSSSVPGGFNGATAFRRWKLTPFAPSTPDSHSLQWGHRLSAMETGRLRCGHPGASRASMGPPPFGDGNESLGVSTKVCLTASMGPPPFGDGNYCYGTPYWYIPVLQWGHRLSAMETLRCCPMKTLRTPNGFNGATAFRRWKPTGCRGSPRGRWPLRFNGATAFRRWKLWNRGNRLCGKSRLQWGHRLSAMETGRHRTRCRSPGIASMGPPPFGDGNEPGMHVGTRFMPLQWGHRLSAMETRDTIPGRKSGQLASMGPPPFGDGNLSHLHSTLGAEHLASMGPPPFGDGNFLGLFGPGFPSLSLQWGHRLSAMETADKILQSLEDLAPRIPRGFNGATAFRRWKRRTKGCRGLGAQCFNGATAFRRWKLGYVLRYVARVDELQWGHRLSAMETSNNPPLPRPRPHASMGPPPFGDGNMTDPKTGVTVECKLQWGHRLSAMETLETNGLAIHSTRSNASMGPPPFGDGNGL